jgi:hypothetical protein
MAGKGDRPRNCFSSQFRDNYDNIKWVSKEKKKDKPAEQLKKGKKIYVYSNSR